MTFAFVCALLFAVSVVSASRSIRHFGPNLANFYRLIIATLCLATFAHVAGFGLRGPAFWWFFVSGCIGFGIGDIALFFAIPRIGARLTILLSQCLAAPIAAVTEWLWLGTRVTLAQSLSGILILAGVAFALAPAKVDATRRALLVSGVVAGIVAALGQGVGAVISRKAYDVSETAGVKIDGMSAAYQRILGGLLVTGLALVPLRVRTPAMNPAAPLLPEINPPRLGAHSSRLKPAGPAEKTPSVRTRGVLWLLLNAIAGPVLGVSFFQWALGATPGALVLPIVALTPIFVMPLAWWLEDDRPGTRAILGGVIAVAGAATLAVAS